MSSSISRDSYSILVKNVTKTYRLFDSRSDQLLELMGISGKLFFKKAEPKLFNALGGVSFQVEKGEKIGIIGRNGAGKTTLLKLLCGHYQPTSGTVSVNGSVQALMGVGMGFHPDHSGRQNVIVSAQYNGLQGKAFDRAVEDIYEFAELGEFLDQPFKTYSLGMQARLMFATATAINPDIVVIDEVLGAGDAYFIAKSKDRLNRLLGSGCTLLLVSHSMGQILELCERVIWVEGGLIRMDGPAFEVVKSFEELLNTEASQYLTEDEGSTTEVDPENKSAAVVDLKPDSDSSAAEENSEISDGGQVDTEESIGSVSSKITDPSHLPDLRLASDKYNYGEPFFVPHQSPADFFVDEISTLQDPNCVAPGGVSRWGDKNKCELEVCSFRSYGKDGASSELRSLEYAQFSFLIKSNKTKKYRCRYSVAISNLNGEALTSLKSNEDVFYGRKGAFRQINVGLNPLQLGSGIYYLSIGIHRYSALEKINSEKRYDLLSRSFEINIKNPDSWASFDRRYFHSSEWRYDEV